MKTENGFTLIELVIAMAVAGMLGAVLLSLYKTAALFQYQTLNEQPLQESSSYIYRRLVQDVGGADCAKVLAGGQALLLYIGHDCEATPNLIVANTPPAPDYAVFCLSADKALLYTSGPWSDIAPNPAQPPGGTIYDQLTACDLSYPGWKSLTLPTVQASGGFSVPAQGASNQIETGLTLNLDPLYAADSEPILFNTKTQWHGGYQ